MKVLIPLFFFFLPFQWALSPSANVDLAIIRLVSLGLFACWMVDGLVRRRVYFPSGWPTFFFVSFFFLALSSLFWAEEAAFTLRKILFLFSFAPLFFVFSDRWFSFPEEKMQAMRAYVWGAFVFACGSLILFFLQFPLGVAATYAFVIDKLLPFFLGEALSQAVALHPSLLVNISGATLLRASGVFPDPHMFAFYMGMTLPFVGALIIEDTRARTKWICIGSILLLADLLSFSRGGYVGLFLGALVLLWGYQQMYSWNLRRTGGVLVIGLCIVFGMVATPMGSRFVSIFSSSDGSNQERLRLWQEAVIHVTERPLLGVGLGNYPLLVKPGVGYREPIYAHNLYLDIVLELGLLGLLAFVSLVGGVIFLLVRAFLVSHDVFALALLASLAIFLGHSFFETPLFSVHVLPAFLFLLSLGVSYGYDTSRH